MIERALMAVILMSVGVIAYRWYARHQIQQAARSAPTDPLLQGLRPGVPAILYFTTPMCVPCRTMQGPTLTRLQEELGETVQIIRVDACEDVDAAERWGVFSAPTLFILNGQGLPCAVNYGVTDANKLKRQLQAANA
jgi:thioredoxin-like negative regulator of GroEL